MVHMGIFIQADVRCFDQVDPSVHFFPTCMLQEDWEDSWLIEKAEARAKRHRGSTGDLHALLRSGLEVPCLDSQKDSKNNECLDHGTR